MINTDKYKKKIMELDAADYNTPHMVFMKAVTNSITIEELLAVREQALCEMKTKVMHREVGEMLGGKVTLTVEFSGVK